MKRRILRRLKINEISGVDNPCQQGAVVTLLKRAPEPAAKRYSPSARQQILKQADALLAKSYDPNHSNTEEHMHTTNKALGELEQQLADMEKQFEKQLAKETSAIVKSGYGEAFDDHVREQIRLGCPPTVAGSRVLPALGRQPAEHYRVEQEPGRQVCLRAGGRFGSARAAFCE